SEVYGRDGADTFLSNLGTLLILRLRGSGAAWASEQFSRAEKESRRAADVYETDEPGERSTFSTTREERSLVLDGEIADLADRHGFLFLPLGGSPVAEVEIPTSHLARGRAAEPFEPVDPRETYLSGGYGFTSTQAPTRASPASGAGQELDI
ncbi:MAG: type IV secretion system DNA-binding domain-containing protein, partial [Proteobacteria bacterium]|nr:type IV secretion system DNA-binding domain-containing protein [Pseudomonadota bacterium]